MLLNYNDGDDGDYTTVISTQVKEEPMQKLVKDEEPTQNEMEEMGEKPQRSREEQKAPQKYEDYELFSIHNS